MNYQFKKELEKLKVANEVKINRVNNENEGLDFEETYRRELKKQVLSVAKSRAAEIVDKLEEAGQEALDRIIELAQSDNEKVATNNAQFIVNHIIGTPVQKSININQTVNIDVIAD